ncbi:hypothetical protein MNBD_GAMMA12-1783 [hydrothermal vent metagenome]|uniref:Excisionase-like domain-containing protein n=1 Tax=hydrothermal vent metagenome TaxID=652676 RepID=A0A3B0Y622_9ZZZZ
MNVTLQTWAKRNYEMPPKLPTLRRWAKQGLILPLPVKVGRTWMVDNKAQYSAQMKLAYNDAILEEILNG